MEHRTIDIDGPVHVLDLGGEGTSGTPLVLVHGLDGSAANWVDVAELAQDHRVVAIDLPGFGRTPRLGRSAKMTAYADLVAEAIRRLDLGPSVVVGNSMGGPVAMLVGSRHPDVTAGVVLVAAAVPREGRLALDPTFSAMLLPFLVPGLAATEPRRRASQPPRQRVRALLDMCFAPGNRESDAAYEEMVRVAEVRDPDDARATWVAAARDLFLWLARRGAFHREGDRVGAPVLVIEGVLDPIIPASSHAALMRRHPDWTHVTMPGIGHVPQLEAPMAFCAQLRRWVTREVATPDAATA